MVYSEEGTTQGDVAAMRMYGLGIKYLTVNLAGVIDRDLCRQADTLMTVQLEEKSLK